MGRLGVIQLNCTDRWEGSVEYWEIYNGFPACCIFYGMVWRSVWYFIESQWPCNVSNTRDSVSSGYPNTEKRVENTTRRCLDSRWNTVSSVWYIFSVETISILRGSFGLDNEYEIEDDMDEYDFSVLLSFQASYYHNTYPFHPMNYSLYLKPTWRTRAMETSLIWNSKIVLMLNHSYS